MKYFLLFLADRLVVLVGSTVKSVVELLSESVSSISVKDEVVCYLTPTFSALPTSQFSNYHGDKCIKFFYLMKLISMW